MSFNVKTKLDFVRSTKNKHVYGVEEKDAATPVPALYIARSVFPDPENPPAVITLDIKGA